MFGMEQNRPDIRMKLKTTEQDLMTAEFAEFYIGEENIGFAEFYHSDRIMGWSKTPQLVYVALNILEVDEKPDSRSMMKVIGGE